MKKLSVAMMTLVACAALAAAPARADEDMEWVKKELKEISAKQEEILQKLETLRSEVDIVKIRVSSR